jgi:hypothetical protein
MLMQKLTTNALLQTLPYVIFLIASALTVKLNDSDNKFQRLFFTGLVTFIVIFAAEYFYIVLTLNPATQESSAIGYFWQIGALLGIGAVSSGLLTFLVTRRL